MEFKKLSAVDSVVEPTQSAQVLIEEDGVIKKTPKNAIGAQADWAENDETSPAFIKNKPVEEPEVYDLDVTASLDYIDENNNWYWNYDVHHVNTYKQMLEKIEAGEALSTKVVFSTMDAEDYRTDDSHLYRMRGCGYRDIGAAHWGGYGEILFDNWSAGAFQLSVCVDSSDEVYFEAWQYT